MPEREFSLFNYAGCLTGLAGRAQPQVMRPVQNDDGDNDNWRGEKGGKHDKK